MEKLSFELAKVLLDILVPKLANDVQRIGPELILGLLPGTEIDPEKDETVPVIPSPDIEIKDESMNRGKVPVNPVILKPTRYCV
jgi:hypothetical protein